MTGAGDVGEHGEPRRHPAVLRIMVCGAAGDGKSSLARWLVKRSTDGGQRDFVVADVTGSEHDTRGLVEGAATADLAIIVIDATRGVTSQTRRHGYLVALLGVRRVLVAVNKMDLVEHAQAAFGAIEHSFRDFAQRIRLEPIAFVPVCAAAGENVASASERMSWNRGASLLGHLEGMGRDPAPLPAAPFRLPVQGVDEFRGIAGVIAGGAVRRGDAVRVLPSGRRSSVAKILVGGAEVHEAIAPLSVFLTLEDEIEVRRGDVVSAADAPPAVANQFEATILWMHSEPLLQGRDYGLVIGTQTVTATVAPIKYRVDVDTLEHRAAKKLEHHEIGVCGLELDSGVVFEPYAESRALGGFLLVDRLTNATVGAGLLHFALRRSQNVHWQALDVNKRARARLSGQKPCVLWFTGLSGAGKSTIANLVEKLLHADGRQTYLLDGDNVRHGLSKDLGFTQEDRVESVRRVAEVARLMVDAGLIVLVSSISPFRAERRMARALLEPGEFFEIFVDTSLATAEARDVKGLYKKARRGELKNFTGIDSPYEAPEAPELHLDTASMSPEEAAAQVFARVRDTGGVNADTGDA